MRAGLHGVNEQFVPAVEAQNNQLQEPPVRVETQPKLACRVVVVQISGIHVTLGRVYARLFTDPVLEC